MRTKTRRILCGWLLCVAGAWAFPASAQMSDEIVVGAVVEVDGKILDPVTIIAAEVEIKSSWSDQNIEGAIQSVDPDTRGLKLVGIQVVLDEAGEVFNARGEAADFGSLAAGMFGDALGTWDGRVLRAHRIDFAELEPGKSSTVELEAPIESVNQAGNSFRIFGLTIQLDPGTKIQLD